jgi:hypothetical protein
LIAGLIHHQGRPDHHSKPAWRVVTGMGRVEERLTTDTLHNLLNIVILIYNYISSSLSWVMHVARSLGNR